MKTLYTLIIITFFSVDAFAQAGVLDNSFGTDGIVTTDFFGDNDMASSIVVRPDGKIIVAGYAYDDQINVTQAALARYSQDGLLDTAFGSGGLVSYWIGDNTTYIMAVALQSNGKIVVAGFSDNSFDVYRITLARFEKDGTIDYGFGDDGIVTTPITGIQDEAWAVGIQADGKIVAAGTVDYGTGNDFIVLRYTVHGNLDNTFGTDGYVTYNSTPWDYATSLAFQPDDKLILAGFTGPNSIDQDIVMIRYLPDGTLDSTFNDSGIVITDVGIMDRAGSIALQPDGKIVLAGESGGVNSLSFIVLRYNPDGKLDTTFNDDGYVTTSAGSNNFGNSVLLQPNGKIIVAGRTDDKIALVCYFPNGSIDSSFGVNGIVTTQIGAYPNCLGAILQDDQKIVVGGYASIGLQDDFVVARYLTDLALGEINFTSPQSSPLIYPNPIQQTETLEYTLTNDEVLTLSLCDVNGKVIKNFFTQQKRTAGAHKEQLNMSELTVGNYFLTLSNGSQKMSVKMMKQ